MQIYKLCFKYIYAIFKFSWCQNRWIMDNFEDISNAVRSVRQTDPWVYRVFRGFTQTKRKTNRYRPTDTEKQRYMHALRDTTNIQSNWHTDRHRQANTATFTLITTEEVQQAYKQLWIKFSVWLWLTITKIFLWKTYISLKSCKSCTTYWRLEELFSSFKYVTMDSADFHFLLTLKDVLLWLTADDKTSCHIKNNILATLFVSVDI